ncbi:hypothetical protein [Pyrobaculum neutrophilum]|uniref:Uncharacterized protein n=1 Tax=Pyrobaculum neutrophilum (strain DSM 2338 / JCM 9278 / NBRC 100436 / V24Sta) TaxID=444157 RepID=B1Y9I1_PYRNV|nr:hypothetical protein [Pyrobaculum neutrophilum]ACB40410.1 hypothetical protein Tneu_1486 [Pyrobaculum neutrophilum V24Sta]
MRYVGVEPIGTLYGWRGSAYLYIGVYSTAGGSPLKYLYVQIRRGRKQTVYLGPAAEAVKVIAAAAGKIAVEAGIDMERVEGWLRARLREAIERGALGDAPAALQLLRGRGVDDVIAFLEEVAMDIEAEYGKRAAEWIRTRWRRLLDQLWRLAPDAG